MFGLICILIRYIVSTNKDEIMYKIRNTIKRGGLMSQNFDYILVDFASPHFFASRCELWLNSFSIKQDVDGCFSTRVVSVSWHFKFHECVYVCVCVYVLYTYIVHKSDFFVHKKLKITYFHSLCCIFFFQRFIFRAFLVICAQTLSAQLILLYVLWHWTVNIWL